MHAFLHKEKSINISRTNNNVTKSASEISDIYVV